MTTETESETVTVNSIWSRYKAWFIAGSVVALIALLILGSFGWYNTVRNGLIDRESALGAQYQSDQAELDTYVKKITEEFSVAQVKSAQLNIILTDAVKGRYDNELSTAQPGKGQLFSAIHEAYPDLSGVNVYDRLITEISAGREQFKQEQKKLLDMIRSYISYRNRGMIHSQWASLVGYPVLTARIGKQTFTGKEALAQMQLIVTSADTNKDFQTGQEGPITFTPPTTGG